MVISLCQVRGSINIDEFFHVKDIVRPGETISSTHLSRRAGGKGANQAVAVANAGGAVRLIGAVGSDGQWVKTLLESYDVDVNNVFVVEETTGRAVIQLTEAGENCIILSKGANYSSLPSFHPSPATHMLLQNEIPLQSTLDQLLHAKSQSPKITTIYNPSPMLTPAQISSEFKWECVDWLIVNEGEARELVGVFDPTSPTDIDGLPEGLAVPTPARPSAILLDRLRSQPKLATTNIICTLGPSGALLCTSTRRMIYEQGISIPKDKVRDTTGAGDCWTGYFVAGLMSQPTTSFTEDKLSALLRRCNQAAALCVMKNGAMESIPMKVDVDNALQARAKIAL